MKYLKLILRILDYMYYRISKAYFKFDGKVAITALLAISLFPTLLFLSLFLVIFSRIYGVTFISKIDSFLNFSILSTQIILLITAYYRYKKIHEVLILRWQNEKEPYKTINGVLVVFGLIFPILLIFLDKLFKN